MFYCVVNSRIYQIKRTLTDLEGNNFIIYREVTMKRYSLKGEIVHGFLARSSRKEFCATEKRFGETFYKMTTQDLNKFAEQIGLKIN